MEEESCEVHSEFDKIHPDKNKKRIVKTRAQTEALEKFYTEHKYPSEPMKIQIADSIGLTEKQVSGWFCHRRLKDKRLLNGETHATGRQDGLSGVIQDRGSGHRQDSCGSSKQGDEMNCDTREVESGRIALQEFPSADLTCERGGKYVGNYNSVHDTTSGSTSSLRNMSSHHNGDPFDMATSRSLIPKFPVEVKGAIGRSGPSGYLKVKGQIENSAVTAVKRQLGRLYREDGPPLSVEFDPLPPGAFESSTESPVDEDLYSREQLLPTAPDISKHHQYPRFNKGFDYKLDMALYNPNMERSKMMHSSDAPENYVSRKSGQKIFSPSYSAYRSADMPESYVKDVPHADSKTDYRMRYRQGIDTVRTDSASDHHMLPYGYKVEGERTESWFHRSNDMSRKMSQREDSEDESYPIRFKGNEYHKFGDEGTPPQQITKDGQFCRERRVTDGNWEANRVEIPLKNEMSVSKKMRGEFAHQQQQTRSFLGSNQPWTSHISRSKTEMPSSFNEDEGSAETSSWMD